MSTHNTAGSSTLEEPCNQSWLATPLDYINPEENPFDPDQPPDPDPDDGHGSSHCDLPFPGGDPDPGDPGDDGSANNSPADDCPDGDCFVDAIMALSGSLRDLHWDPAPKFKKIKVRDSNTFDGSNPYKLRDFLVSCNLHFRDCPQVFAADEKRILFILSYLRGSALSWFEPRFNDPTNSAHWMWDYPAFLSELEDNFGPHDPVGNAEKSLHELSMKKGACIVKYNTDFWELASHVS